MSTRTWPALVCRIRQHDDAVVALARRVAVARLQCARCGRRRLVPGPAPQPGLLDGSGAVLVDRGALADLQLRAAVESALTAALLDGGGS